MAALRPAGIMTALVTPFRTDGEVNYDVLSNLIEYQIQSGVSGVVVTAGAGEYLALRPDERAAIISHAAGAIAGRITLIAGILAPETGSAIEAAIVAQEAGAQALLLLTPFYVSPSPAGLVDHVRRVAQAVPLPVIVYNNPGRTGINLDVAVLEQMAEMPAVVAIKECDRDLGRVAQKISRVGERAAFLSGDDDLCLPMWSIGATGSVMAATNLIAPWLVACLAAASAGDGETARETYYSRILPFTQLYRGPDHPAPLKQVLTLAGFPVGPARPPLQSLDANQLTRLRRDLETLGVTHAAQRLGIAD